MKNRWLAAALNILPGVGYLYLGVRKLFAVLLLSVIPTAGIVGTMDPTMAATSDDPTGWGVWLIIGLPVLAFMIDAFQETARVNVAGTKHAEVPAKDDTKRELDHYADQAGRYNRRYEAFSFLQIASALTVLSFVLGIATGIFTAVDDNYRMAMNLSTDVNVVASEIGEMVLGAFILLIFLVLIFFGVRGAMRRRPYIHSIGVLDFWPNDQNRPVTYVKWALLIGNMWLVAFWVSHFEYVNPTVAVCDILSDVLLVAAICSITSVLSALYTKPRNI